MSNSVSPSSTTAAASATTAGRSVRLPDINAQTPTSHSAARATVRSPQPTATSSMMNSSVSARSMRSPLAFSSRSPPPATSRRDRESGGGGGSSASASTRMTASMRGLNPAQQAQKMQQSTRSSTRNNRSPSSSGRGTAAPMTSSSRRGGGGRSPTQSIMGRSSLGGAASLRGGAESRMKAEQMMKRSQKKIRDLMKLEIKLRADADQERQEFIDKIYSLFDSERESVIFKTINRLNSEVASLKGQVNNTEQTWRQRWRRVLGECGKMTDMLTGEKLIDEERCPSNTVTNLTFANDSDGRNSDELANTLTFITKDVLEKVQNLKRDTLNQQLRGDDLQSKLDGRTQELVAADRLIRTHLVGRGSEATIAVDLFRKQGQEFERRFDNLEKEFRARVDELLRDSASIEMVGSHNAEDAILAKLKQNRELLAGGGGVGGNDGGKTIPTSSSSTTKPNMSEENARRVETSKNWRPSGKNYVDILETFITSMECQKILQVQLLREVQLAMIDLSKKHFQNITSEIRKNRSNLPNSVRNKLFDEKSVTRDDLVEMMDLLSFEPKVAEMIMGRFPPTELDDAAPTLERFLESHSQDLKNFQQQQQQRSAASVKDGSQLNNINSNNSTDGHKFGNASSTAASLIQTAQLSNMTVDGGDARSAGVDLSDMEHERAIRRRQQQQQQQQQLVDGEQYHQNSSSSTTGGGGVSGGGRGPIQAFGNKNQFQERMMNPKRVQLPRKPFELYSSKLVYSTKSGFSEINHHDESTEPHHQTLTTSTVGVEEVEQQRKNSAFVVNERGEIQ